MGDSQVTASQSKWQENLGVLTPYSTTRDLNIGATATSGAKLSVDGSLDRGLAAVIINQTENQDLFTASYGGTPKFTVANTGTVTTGIWDATDISLGAGGTGASLTDPNADRIMFWDESVGSGSTAWLTVGTGLSLTDVTLTHTDSSAVADSNNSTTTVIQDLGFDDLGHVDSIGTDLASYFVQTANNKDYWQENLGVLTPSWRRRAALWQADRNGGAARPCSVGLDWC